MPLSIIDDFLVLFYRKHSSEVSAGERPRVILCLMPNCKGMAHGAERRGVLAHAADMTRVMASAAQGERSLGGRRLT